jgi:hypothetical protein
MPQDHLDRIADKVAYKAISIKDGQRYIFKKFNIDYNKQIIDILYEIRNKLMHGEEYDDETVHNMTRELFDLLDRTLLKMFGWKGQTYISKKNNYKPTVLR